jgi:CO/xanthine dehydrogenase Mo-binding subunit
MTPAKKYNSIGSRVPRVDALDKVTGRARYAADFNLPGQLYGHVRYADYPHADIISIDTSKAKALPGVVKVLTARDVPGERKFGAVVIHQIVLCADRVRYYGDVVALVAALTPEIAEQAASLIEVEYKELTPITDPQTAMKKVSPKVYPEGNLCTHHKVRRGDIEKGFASSDVVIEREYKTQKIEHSYIEPEAVLAEPGEHGGVTITGTLQNLYNIRRSVARVLNLPLNRVRLIQPALGGSFGGKDETLSALCCRAAFLALVTGKSVKMVNSREQSMRESYKRHPYQLRYKIGATKAGVIKAIESEMYADVGPYAAMSPFVTWRSVVHATGPYRIANVKTDVYAVYTNNCYTGAMRGFGSPQVCFAVESLLDELAEKLGMDPYELRRKNFLKNGSITATGQKLDHKVGVAQALANVVEQADFKNKWIANKQQSGDSQIKKGIGLSCSYRGISLGAEGTDAAGVIISLQTDGSLVVTTGLVEMGQGAATTISLIVAEEFGVTTDRIRFLYADTTTTPDSGPTVASRTTFMAGNAARKGCAELLKRIKPVAAELLHCPMKSLRFADNHIYNNDKKKKSPVKISFGELTQACFDRGISLFAQGWYKGPHTSWDEHTGKGTAYFTYVYGANLAEVEVDSVTGKVKVTKFYSSHDLGKVINLNGALGQVYGGVAMGLGYGLLESYAEQDSCPQLENFDEYLLPTICDIPDVDVTFVENYDKLGPFGAKSLGEPACELAAPAIANAVYNAIGMRIRELPLTLEQVLLGRNLARTDSRGSTKARSKKH